MGAGWRRFAEQTRQKWSIGEKEFLSTPNTRNEMMLKEAGEFAGHLKRCEKDIRALKNATEGLLVTAKVVLGSPLPRVYEETGGGKVVPVSAAVPGSGAPGAANTSAAMSPIGGTDFSAEELARISKETGKKLESEVLAPMERWMNAFSLVHNRMKKLEALRLEVDSRRRTVARLGRRVDMQRAQLPQTRARGEYEMENTIKVLQHKESKLSACRQSYKEHEALVYHQLTNLIRDTVWLKSYLSAVLRVEAEAFSVANVALGSMKAALPAALTNGSEGAAPPAVPLTSSMDAGSDAIAAARSDGAPISSGAPRRKDTHGLSITATAATKDSLYTMDDDAEHGGIGVGGHRAASAAPAYDRYGVADSTYSRAPMSACSPPPPPPAAAPDAGNPLPRTLHAVLPDNKTRFKRVIVVGDVHGCVDELRLLLERCHYHADADVLVSVGDLVNKGPDSRAVLQLAADTGAMVVRGNHDEAALAAYRDVQAGRPLKKARYEWVRGIDAGLARLMRELPFSLRLPAYGVTVVHAGLVPGTPLQEQTLHNLITMRDLVPASLLETAAADNGDAESEAGAPPPRQDEPITVPPGWDWEKVVQEAEAAGSTHVSAVGSTNVSAAAHSAGDGAAASPPVTAAVQGGARGALLRQLEPSEKRDPAGAAWASIWRGPGHVLFGHDAGRRLQLEPCATGLDGGCVYGGKMYAAVLPPLDAEGQAVAGEPGTLPPDAVPLLLSTGLRAHLVSVPANRIYSPPKAKQLPH